MAYSVTDEGVLVDANFKLGRDELPCSTCNSPSVPKYKNSDGSRVVYGCTRRGSFTRQHVDVYNT